ncbi:MAG TPA: substrate-binding domain-containing protein [Candidatus Limnocylindrales bacterium]|nr:substrate-binding domain-containing protein [Candidatus Limnocylindrales bacterium]
MPAALPPHVELSPGPVRTVGTMPSVSAAASSSGNGSLLTSPPARPATPEAIADQSTRPALGTNSQRRKSVAVVITEPPTRIFGDPFFSVLFTGIYDALGERSLLPLMLAPQSAKDLGLAEAYLLQGHFDGVVLISLHGDNQLPNRLRDARIPAVLWGTPARGIVASYIDSDSRQGARLAVEHLISLGRRHIATISGNLDMTGAVDRLMGYRDALVAGHIALDPTLEEVADFLPNRAHMAMERLLLNHPDVDAVFVASDMMAAAAIGVLHQAGKRIPEDIAVVGFDDSPTALSTHPSLSTIRQPIEQMGHEAISMLMREMQEPGRAPDQLVLATELVVRESSAGART